jgi:hypothetical protein
VASPRCILHRRDLNNMYRTDMCDGMDLSLDCRIDSFEGLSVFEGMPFLPERIQTALGIKRGATAVAALTFEPNACLRVLCV